MNYVDSTMVLCLTETLIFLNNYTT